MNEQKTVEKNTYPTRRAAKRLIIKITTIATIIFILLHFVIFISINHGNNMYPSLRDGDLCFSYLRGEYSVNKIVAYKENGITRYGRIVATAGHEVDITNEGLTVDGSLQYEKVVYPTTKDGTTVTLPYTVPEGSVFILNDYREDVSDSRTCGSYQLSELKGTVVLVLRRREF